MKFNIIMSQPSIILPYHPLDDPDITCGTWAPQCIKDVKNNSRMTKCANAGFTPVFGWFSLFFKERTLSKGQEHRPLIKDSQNSKNQSESSP